MCDGCFVLVLVLCVFFLELIGDVFVEWLELVFGVGVYVYCNFGVMWCSVWVIFGVGWIVMFDGLRGLIEVVYGLGVVFLFLGLECWVLEVEGIEMGDWV